MKISGGILAGGEGRRFGGADKGWLPYRGRGFVEHVCDALAPQVDDLVISANRNLARYAALGHRVVADTIGRGPAAGLLQLLETARHPWLLCAPCDALALPPTLAYEMADLQGAEEADIVVLRDGERAHPTCSLLPASLAPDLRRYLLQGHTALWRWQSRFRVAYLPVPSPFANANDERELARLGA